MPAGRLRRPAGGAAAARGRRSRCAGALAASDADDLPPAGGAPHACCCAAAQARRGDTDRRAGGAGPLDTAAADEARATILERAKDWPAAERALADYARKTVPPEGRLDDGQRRTLLRLATAAARAGDDGGARGAAAKRETTRMEAGPLADMFRLLTAEPVRGVADLPRSGQEAALARGLPGQPEGGAAGHALRRGPRDRASSARKTSCIPPPLSPCSAALAPGRRGSRPLNRPSTGRKGTR